MLKSEIMNEKDILSLLEENKNERGIKHWNDKFAERSGLKSFGLGITALRKLAKKVGRDHELAKKLWESEVYDAKMMSILIDDPKKITREQAEVQVNDMNQAYLAHVFSSCDAPLAKTPFVKELSVDWMSSDSNIKKSCGYGLLYEISKSKKKDAPDDDFFLHWIEHIRSNFHKEHLSVQGSMGGALLGIGKRNLVLNQATLKLAKELGPIHFETEGEYCEPMDLVKHMTSDYLKEKLGIS